MILLDREDEREELQLNDAKELKRIEEEMQKQYNMENIFNEKNESLTEIIVYKEPGFLKKLFNLVKGVFAKNKI